MDMTDKWKVKPNGDMYRRATKKEEIAEYRRLIKIGKIKVKDHTKVKSRQKKVRKPNNMYGAWSSYKPRF